MQMSSLFIDLWRMRHKLSIIIIIDIANISDKAISELWRKSDRSARRRATAVRDVTLWQAWGDVLLFSGCLECGCVCVVQA
jgi:5-methylthioribose kinase